MRRGEGGAGRRQGRLGAKGILRAKRAAEAEKGVGTRMGDGEGPERESGWGGANETVVGGGARLALRVAVAVVHGTENLHSSGRAPRTGDAGGHRDNKSNKSNRTATQTSSNTSLEL